MKRIHTDYIKQIFEKLDNISRMLDSFYSTLSAFTPNEHKDKMTIAEKIDRVKHAIDSDMKSSPESKLQHYVDRGYIPFQLACVFKDICKSDVELHRGASEGFKPLAVLALVDYMTRNYEITPEQRSQLSMAATKADIQIVKMMM